MISVFICAQTAFAMSSDMIESNWISFGKDFVAPSLVRLSNSNQHQYSILSWNRRGVVLLRIFLTAF